jgi:hypothetical protein
MYWRGEDVCGRAVSAMLVRAPNIRENLILLHIRISGCLFFAPFLRL